MVTFFVTFVNLVTPKDGVKQEFLLKELMWVCWTSKSDMRNTTKCDPNHISDIGNFGHTCSSCLAPTLGVTKIMIVKDLILVTRATYVWLRCSTNPPLVIMTTLSTRTWHSPTLLLTFWPIFTWRIDTGPIVTVLLRGKLQGYIYMQVRFHMKTAGLQNKQYFLCEMH